MKMLETVLRNLSAELHRFLQDKLNAATFGPPTWTLPTPRVLVMEAKRSKAVRGWYARRRWEQGAVNLDEIVLTPDSISQGVLAAAAVLVHEYVHLANAVASRPDTSRQGRYHNSLFRETAQAMGMKVCQDPGRQQGWCVTELGSELADMVRRLIREKTVSVHPFRYHRRASVAGRRALVKLVAECCDEFVYVTRARADTIQVCCGLCGRPFRPERYSEK